MEVLHKPHGTKRDRTVLHKSLVSAMTRITPGPAQTPEEAAFAVISKFLPQRTHGPPLLCHTIFPELVLPQASVCKLSTDRTVLEDLSHRSLVCKHCSQILGTVMQAITTSSSPTGAPAGCSQACFAAMPWQANPHTCSSSLLKMHF